MVLIQKQDDNKGKKNKLSEFRTEIERRGLKNINNIKEKKTSSKVRGLGEKGQE